MILIRVGNQETTVNNKVRARTNICAHSSLVYMQFLASYRLNFVAIVEALRKRPLAKKYSTMERRCM